MSIISQAPAESTRSGLQGHLGVSTPPTAMLTASSVSLRPAFYSIYRPFLSNLPNHAMSLPGLGFAEPEEPVAITVSLTDSDIGKECEWRFEVGVGSYTQVKVCY